MKPLSCGICCISTITGVPSAELSTGRSWRSGWATRTEKTVRAPIGNWSRGRRRRFSEPGSFSRSTAGRTIRRRTTRVRRCIFLCKSFAKARGCDKAAANDSYVGTQRRRSGAFGGGGRSGGGDAEAVLRALIRQLAAGGPEEAKAVVPGGNGPGGAAAGAGGSGSQHQALACGAGAVVVSAGGSEARKIIFPVSVKNTYFMELPGILFV